MDVSDGTGPAVRLFSGWAVLAGWLFLGNLIINVYPIMVQRYNRARIQRYLDRRSRTGETDVARGGNDSASLSATCYTEPLPPRGEPKMIDANTARQLMLKYLTEAERVLNATGSALPNHGPPLHLTINDVSEYDFGWVFCYNTKEFLETGDLSFALGGNAPIIADRKDGQLYVTGTANPLEFYLEQYRSGIRNRA